MSIRRRTAPVRAKSPDDVAIWHRHHRAYLWDQGGHIHFSDTPKYLSSLSKAKARARCDMGIDLYEVEFRLRRDIESASGIFG